MSKRITVDIDAELAEALEYVRQDRDSHKWRSDSIRRENVELRNAIAMMHMDHSILRSRYNDLLNLYIRLRFNPTTRIAAIRWLHHFAGISVRDAAEYVNTIFPKLGPAVDTSKED